MKRSLYVLCLLAVVAIVSCTDGKGDSKQETEVNVDPRMDVQMERTNADSMAIIRLTKDYLDKLKADDIDGALAMLYERDSTGAVKPASEQKKAEMRQTYNAFPVVDYEITRMTLFSEDDTEVFFTVKFFETTPETEGMPNTVKQAIQPLRRDGQWYVTIPGVIVGS